MNLGLPDGQGSVLGLENIAVVLSLRLGGVHMAFIVFVEKRDCRVLLLQNGLEFSLELGS